MTGYGRSSAQYDTIRISAEIKALNARQTDVRVKLPAAYSEAEHSLRKTAQAAAHRGKIEVIVGRQSLDGSDLDQGINTSLFQRYRTELLELDPNLAEQPAILASAVLRLPGMVGTNEETVEEAEIALLNATVQQALEKFVAFRQNEGAALYTDLIKQVDLIEHAVPRIESHEEERQKLLRARLARLIKDNLSGSAVDQNRLEQEVIYYLEKIDISEEKVRLIQHCAFFREKIDDAEVQKGRRLNFVTQEMGREINTLGAKAYNSNIQREIVGMKEALERIKEQIANVV